MGTVQAILAHHRRDPDRVDSHKIANNPLARLRIAILVPCYNEEAAIAKVVADFRASLPQATVYVYRSKLNTWRDGIRILGTIVKLYRAERPLGFFSAIGISFGLVSIGIAIPIFLTYLTEGIVPRLPTAVLSTGLMMIACLAIACSLVLDTVTRGRREIKRLAYLSFRPPAMSSSAANTRDSLGAVGRVHLNPPFRARRRIDANPP